MALLQVIQVIYSPLDLLLIIWGDDLADDHSCLTGYPVISQPGFINPGLALRVIKT